MSDTPAWGEPSEAEFETPIPRRSGRGKKIVAWLLVISMFAGAATLLVIMLTADPVQPVSETPTTEGDRRVRLPDAGARFETCRTEKDFFEQAIEIAKVTGDDPRNLLDPPVGEFFQIDDAGALVPAGELPPGCANS